MDDLWSWHSYIYAFRRVKLGIFLDKSPTDEQGEWYNPGLIQRAERYYREKLGIKPRPGEQPTARYDEIRPNWKRIPSPELTDAEHELADPAIARMSAEAQRTIAEIAARGRRAFKDKNTHHEERNGIERPVRAATVDVSPEELMARVGGYAIKTESA